MNGSPIRSEVDVVVLDVGRVIVDYDFDRAYRTWCPELGVGEDRLRAALRHEALALAFERGQLSEAAFVATLAERIGRPMSLESFASGWNAIFESLVPGIDALIPRIADRVRLLALSNTNATHAAFWKTRYAPVFVRFERLFCSHEMGTRKPERAIYDEIVQYAGVPPHRVVLFDDIPEFVDGARSAGLRGFVAEGTASIETHLRTLGVL
jgi:putative hydrolase of the HAD superfamily